MWIKHEDEDCSTNSRTVKYSRKTYFNDFLEQRMLIFLLLIFIIIIFWSLNPQKKLLHITFICTLSVLHMNYKSLISSHHLIKFSSLLPVVGAFWILEAFGIFFNFSRTHSGLNQALQSGCTSNTAFPIWLSNLQSTLYPPHYRQGVPFFVCLH